MQIEPENIAQMEAALAEAGVARDDFLNKAQVHPATWNRWKAGKFEPNRSKWRGIKAAFTAILAEAGKPVDAPAG